MKKILVPTDFSENAKNALDYAIELARHFDGTIHLLHIYLVPGATGSFIDIERHMVAGAETSMQELIRHVKQKWPEDAKVSYRLLHGYPIPYINSFSKDFDLVVMGTQGESWLKELFVGSTTKGVIKGAACPVLAIPNGFRFRPPATLAFATDDPSVAEDDLPELLVTFADRFDAEIKVFHISDPHDVEMEVNAPGAVADAKVSYHYTPKKADIHTDINHFVRKNRAELLGMIARKHGFFNRIFIKSVTKQEVFRSEVPVLVFLEK